MQRLYRISWNHDKNYDSNNKTIIEMMKEKITIIMIVIIIRITVIIMIITVIIMIITIIIIIIIIVIITIIITILTIIIKIMIAITIIISIKKCKTHNDILPNGGGRKGFIFGSSRPVPTFRDSTSDLGTMLNEMARRPLICKEKGRLKINKN